MIKVRFAPSPTGYLHIGGARTALFNWMYARAQNGTFVLRIEDTDRVRSKKEYEDEILESMSWLGLDWEEIYHQSQRGGIYDEHAANLLEQGKAYRDGQALILKMPHEEVKIHDIIRGEIVFDTSTLKDQVLIKSDGSPTYSFACVIDDSSMGITHVIRGEDHISNTPKQIMIYNALGLKIPKYAHLPLILGEDGARLSKRSGAVAVSDYRKRGYLPEAMVNALMLLGWSPGNDQEVMPLEKAVKKFSIKRVNKAAAIFSMDKLNWINSQYLRQMPSEKLMELLAPRLEEKGYINGNFDRQRLKSIVDLFKGRLTTLDDFLEWTDFIFVDEVVFDEESRAKHLSGDKSREFGLLGDRIKAVDPFTAETVEKAFRQVVEELGVKASDLVHPVRVVLTGRAVGPGLFETMAVLGKEKTVERLSRAFT